MLIYAVYALFLVFALASFGGLIASGFANAPPPSGNWVAGGITYASYNIVGAVVILPVLRHLTSQRDAVVAGLIAGNRKSVGMGKRGSGSVVHGGSGINNKKK